LKRNIISEETTCGELMMMRERRKFLEFTGAQRTTSNEKEKLS